MTAARKQEDVHRLIVTGPARDRLYERFLKLYTGRRDVVVIKDRRQGERRSAGAAVARDRRRADRRSHAPDWVFPPD